MATHIQKGTQFPFPLFDFVNNGGFDVLACPPMADPSVVQVVSSGLGASGFRFAIDTVDGLASIQISVDVQAERTQSGRVPTYDADGHFTGYANWTDTQTLTGTASQTFTRAPLQKYGWTAASTMNLDFQAEAVPAVASTLTDYEFCAAYPTPFSAGLTPVKNPERWGITALAAIPLALTYTASTTYASGGGADSNTSDEIAATLHVALTTSNAAPRLQFRVAFPNGYVLAIGEIDLGAWKSPTGGSASGNASPDAESYYGQYQPLGVAMRGGWTLAAVLTA